MACADGKLLMDYAAAVAYVNKIGGTHAQELSNLALDLWEWCIRHHKEISAHHLPRHLNVRADRESGLLLHSSDWKLNPAVFQLIPQRWGSLVIDLFASHLTYLLKQFVR